MNPNIERIVKILEETLNLQPLTHGEYCDLNDPICKAWIDKNVGR